MKRKEVGAGKTLLVLICILSMVNVAVTTVCPTIARAGAISQLEGMTGQKIDRPTGGRRDYPERDPDAPTPDITNAPIVMMPVGTIGGVFMGGYWYFKEMAGGDPKVGFFSSYMKNQKLSDKDDTNKAFDAGAFIGGLPWLALYAVTGPIRYGVVAIADSLSKPSPPRPKSGKELAQAAFDAGKILETSGNWAAAADKYAEALRNDPGSAECKGKLKNALHRLGGQLAERGRHADAVKALERAVALDGNDAVAIERIADIQGRNLGRKDLAEAGYRKAASVYSLQAATDPNYPVVVGKLIETVNELGRESQGRALARQEALLSQGDVVNAGRQARQSVAVEPGSARAWTNLGVALERQGGYLEAEAAYREAVRLDPSPANRERLEAFLRNGKRAEAFEKFKSGAGGRVTGMPPQGGGAPLATDLENARYVATKCFLEGGCYRDTAVDVPPVPPPTRVDRLIGEAPDRVRNDDRFVRLVKENAQLETLGEKAAAELRKLKELKVDDRLRNALVAEQSDRLQEIRKKQDECTGKIGAIYLDFSIPLPDEPAGPKGK